MRSKIFESETELGQNCFVQAWARSLSGKTKPRLNSAPSISPLLSASSMRWPAIWTLERATSSVSKTSSLPKFEFITPTSV